MGEGKKNENEIISCKEKKKGGEMGGKKEIGRGRRRKGSEKEQGCVRKRGKK